MERPFKFMKETFGHHATYVIAGDIFDKWNSPAELINLAMKILPSETVYAIPGQHDLAYHNLEDIRKTAYWTLVESGVIENLKYGEPFELASAQPGFKDVGLYAYPWGQELVGMSASPKKKKEVNVAVVHKYVWVEGHSFPGAPKDGHVAELNAKLADLNMDYGFFGDNHKGFIEDRVFNCGGLIPRKSDEREYKPRVYVLSRKTGLVTTVYVPTNRDLWETKVKEENESSIDLTEFLADVGNLEEVVLNFAEAVGRALAKRKVDDPVRKFITKIMEGLDS